MFLRVSRDIDRLMGVRVILWRWSCHLSVQQDRIAVWRGEVKLRRNDPVTNEGPVSGTCAEMDWMMGPPDFEETGLTGCTAVMVGGRLFITGTWVSGCANAAVENIAAPRTTEAE